MMVGLRPTKTQLALIREGTTPLLRRMGSGGGLVIGDPRTIRALVAQGLAFKPDNAFGFDWRCKAWLTRKAFELVGTTPPPRHPCDNNKPWP